MAKFQQKNAGHTPTKQSKIKQVAKSSKSSTSKKNNKSSKSHTKTSATSKSQKAVSHKSGPSKEQLRKEKMLIEQNKKASQATAAANKRANSAEASLAKANTEVRKANSKISQYKDALAGEMERAGKAEFENAKLLQEVTLKKEANLVLNTKNIELSNKIKMFESEEAKMARKIQEQTLKMQEQAQAMLDALNDEADEPPVEINGISSGFAGAKAAEKIYQDQTAVEIDIDTIDDLDDLSISVLRPEILIKHAGSYNSKDSDSGIGSNKYLDLFAGNVLRELLHNDAATFSFIQFQDTDPDLLEAASQRVEAVYDQIEEEVDALISYREMIDQAAVSLDLHQCKEEIGSLMIDSVSEMLQPEDGALEDLPSDLIELVSAVDNFKGDIDKSYSNTKIYYSLLANIYQTFTGYSPHLGPESNQTSKPLSYVGTNRDKYTLSALKKNQKNQTKSGDLSVVRKGYTAIFPAIDTSNLTSDIQKFLSCLSNELIMSAGINRLTGTELGNKYGVASDKPLDVVIGANMAQMYHSKGVVIPESDAKKGSLLDFITSEDTDSKRVVLPFEVNDITMNKKKYLPGSDYLVEGPARKLDISFNDPVGKFSENFSGEVASAKRYFEDLLALTESVLLSPQGIFIRILEDIYTICLEGSKPIDFVDRNAVKSYLKFSLATASRDQKYNKSSIPWHKMNSTDTNAIIQHAIDQETQPAYRLSVDQTILSELENTDKFYSSRSQFNRLFSDIWRWYIGELKTDKTSTAVIPLGKHPVSFEIEGSGETQTVHKMIIDLADELMSETENFAARGGIEASYKNSEGRTTNSNLDYSALIAMLQQIYHALIHNFFHWSPISRGSTGDYRRAVRLETEKNKVTADALLAILSTYKEGAKFSDLFDEEGNALAVEGVSSSTKIGKNITMGQITDAIEGMRHHRAYLKCCISALEAISSNISKKSMPLSKFQKSAREVITNKTRLENVKNKKLASFCRLVKLPIGSDCLRGLTSMQCSNTILSRARLEPSDSPDMRQKRAVLSPGLLEAMKIFHETPLFRGSQNILCVGLPNGMIDKLKTSNVDINKREAVSESSREFSLVFSCDNELFSSLSFEDYSVDFDSSIYIFPDSYDNYIPAEEDESGLLKTPDPFRDLVNKTIFHRVVGGVVVESETGSVLIEQGDDKTYEILSNHVYSDLVRISAELTLMLGVSEADVKKYTDLNISSFSSEGFSLMRAMQKSANINMMTLGIEKALAPVLIDEKNVFYRLGKDAAARRAFSLMTDNDQNDIVRFSSCGLFTAELDRHKILSTSIFDRVFYAQVNLDDFELDMNEGLNVERKRYLGKTRPNQGNDTFDLTGIYCEVRVK